MIHVNEVTKQFENMKALNAISLSICEGEIFGLLGTNGSGKSTLLRLLAGVLKEDIGEIKIDDSHIFENEMAKQDIFYISDEAYFMANATPIEMGKFYEMVYSKFDMKKYHELLTRFGFEEKRMIHTFSKGVKKQLSILLGICSNAQYLLCDETFDGLDAVMRKAMKAIFVSEMIDRKLTPIITSHNIRELEDVCEHVALLHKGNLIFSKYVNDLQLYLNRVQCVFEKEEEYKAFCDKVEVIHSKQQGKLSVLTVRASKSEIVKHMENQKPTFFEILPLSLEEIVISEAEVAGYEVQNFID